MYCTKCGVQLKDGANFCSDCGSPTASNAYSVRPYPKLSRPREDRKIAGVCAGFAEYFDIDVTVVRVVWLIVALFGGGGILAYIIAWIIMPEEPEYVPVAPPAAPPELHQGQ